MHTPVLFNEVVTFLDPHPEDFIIDGTMDGGGHAAAIVSKVSPGGMFLGVDLDRELVARTAKTILGMPPASLLSRIVFHHGNYADLPAILEKEKMPKADGLLLDLGFSSEQLEASGRGFSFKDAAAKEPLLMTYDDSLVPLSEVLGSIKEQELADILFNLGGERRSRAIAKAIVEGKRHGRIETAGDLASIVRNAVPAGYEHGRIDAATRTFQALRIYVNGELENLEKLIGSLGEIVGPGGRVVILTFHSLEDRVVKHAFRKLEKDGQAELLVKKPIEATREEVRENPRSRSAKLRAIKMC